MRNLAGYLDALLKNWSKHKKNVNKTIAEFIYFIAFVIGEGRARNASVSNKFENQM
ncbi:hypothetical protein JNL27_01100 [bacterium]|nr:hypothetical protein [bacterium]